MNVSVVVPTFNAGALLDDLLAALANQRFERGSVELVAADSGSTDGTRERLVRAGARLIDVPAGTFDHGATRDLAISSSTGDIAILVVQDAVPGSRDWIEGLAREFASPAVAGTFCRQVARPDAPAVVALRLRESMYGSKERRDCRLERGVELASLPPFERFRLCAFDNVCSAVRRTVWEDIRFGPRAFAEDLVWSKRAILAGHTITYTPDVHVIHSHDRSVGYEYRRTYLSHYTLYELFEVRTVPKAGMTWHALTSAGPWIRAAWYEEPTLARRVRGAIRAPVERFATAVAQYQGARDAALGRPARRFRGI
ncbi:MAG TPA: glycosyltransferase [Planctomycetota bacterium]|jgi:rhamnosyltransferase|nr:glycosyltransferase [Planctomycetota bacterium]